MYSVGDFVMFNIGRKTEILKATILDVNNLRDPRERYVLNLPCSFVSTQLDVLHDIERDFGELLLIGDENIIGLA